MGTIQRIQERTLDSFHDKNGKCRLIFATNALGMGVNFQDIRFIVHYGPPREMEELVQQIGRAGRDGKPAHALIMYNGRHLKNCDQSVKDMCKATSGCLRKRMLADFGVEDLQSQEKHNCCINCHKECLCSDDKCPIPFPEISRTKTTIKENLNTRKITLEQKQLLEELLRDNISVMSSGLLNFLGVDGTALFSESLIKKVLKHAKFVFTTDYILENLPVFKSEHAMDILCMFNDVFEDVDEGELDANQCSSFDEDYIYNVEMYICDEFLEESSDSDCTISDTDDELV
ncbi:ATP-dependent DNA helicase tlh2 [Exaiptasia diaphana]|nr:ATP-dependent DNA helicase tlh2 [Exaiptasia diaphana]